MGIDRVLVVDDEADIHAVTKLSLKGLKLPNRKLEILSASSGKEAVETMRKHPDIAVILLDVVMEKDDAGLTACRAIREENRLVRILLRTGQPGIAPERQTIDDYDIDGYLPKSEITAAKLYSAVRTALRAHGDLVELDRHRKVLTAINDCAISLRSFAPLTDTLQRVLDTARAMCPGMALLQLETHDRQGEIRRYVLRTGGDELRGEELRSRVVRAGAMGALREPTSIEGGYVVPLNVHRELGHGWIFVELGEEPDPIVQSALPVLAAHAANALYSSLAESMLRAEQAPIFDTMTV